MGNLEKKSIVKQFYYNSVPVDFFKIVLQVTEKYNQSNLSI